MTLLPLLLTAFLSWTTPIASAQQYLGPEEVLLQQETSIYQAPGSDRETRRLAEERERARQERLMGRSSSSSEASELPTLHPAAGDEIDASGDGEVVIGTSDDVANELDMGGDSNPIEPIYLPPYDDAQNALPGSGPALALAMIALAAAGVWTVVRALRSRAFTR